jgi:hypothetical protein
MESSIVVRDRRRKSRSAVELKQNCGVSDGGSYDFGVISSPDCLRDGEDEYGEVDGEGDGEDGDDGVLFQKKEAVVNGAGY